MTRYVGLLDGAEGAYGIVVPDLPGCVAAGATINETVQNGVEAVRDWIIDAREDGEAIPTPRDMLALKSAPDIKNALQQGDAAFVMIPVVINSGRPMKANLSLDAGLLEAIDDAAKESGLTRSSFLATAAREKIEYAQPVRPSRKPAVKAAATTDELMAALKRAATPRLAKRGKPVHRRAHAGK
jgi:predicted RNase H-like HicB family nuclease